MQQKAEEQRRQAHNGDEFGQRIFKASSVEGHGWDTSGTWVLRRGKSLMVKRVGEWSQCLDQSLGGGLLAV